MGLYDVGAVQVRGDMDLSDSFAWNEYLEKTGSTPAPWECFKQSRTPPENLFPVDSLLEAVDQRVALSEVPSLNPPPVSGAAEDPAASPSASSGGSRLRRTSAAFGSSPTATTTAAAAATSSSGVRRFRTAPFSLARVVETAGPRLRVRLVGTDDRNDCWFLVDSEEIRPYPSNEILQPPFGYVHNHLVWNKTLKRTVEEGKAASPECFIKPPPDPAGNLFKKGDKLEAVDRHNPQLICPATVGGVAGVHVLVRFDGWSGNFDYWARFDSRDLFPCGWCRRVGHPLQAPGPTALLHLNLTPTKMPTAASKPHLSPNSLKTLAAVKARRKTAAAKRKRLTLSSSGGSRRPRLSLQSHLPQPSDPAAANPDPSTAPAPRKAASLGFPVKFDPQLSLPTSPASPPEAVKKSVTPPQQPPLPRITVITKTREDGSPHTIIKTSPSSRSTPGPQQQQQQQQRDSVGSASSPLGNGLPPLPPPPSTETDGGDVRRKKSKRHHRHDSKERRHRHSNSELHRSVSFSESKPTKLVIRHRSGDLTTSKPGELYIDTLEFSPPPPLSAPYSSKLSPASPTTNTPATALQPAPPASLASTVSNAVRKSSLELPSASPASMDMGPRPLPPVNDWTTEDVYNYLTTKDSSLVEVAITFKQQEIDGSALMLLDLESMRTLLHMKLGPALKIEDIVNRLKHGNL